jgi:hypothetical protein
MNVIIEPTIIVVPTNDGAAKVIRTNDETIQPEKPRGMPLDTDTKRKKQRALNSLAKNATLTPRKSSRQHKQPDRFH